MEKNRIKEILDNNSLSRTVKDSEIRKILTDLGDWGNLSEEEVMTLLKTDCYRAFTALDEDCKMLTRQICLYEQSIDYADESRICERLGKEFAYSAASRLFIIKYSNIFRAAFPYMGERGERPSDYGIDDKVLQSIKDIIIDYSKKIKLSTFGLDALTATHTLNQIKEKNLIWDMVDENVHSCFFQLLDEDGQLKFVDEKSLSKSVQLYLHCFGSIPLRQYSLRSSLDIDVETLELLIDHRESIIGAYYITNGNMHKENYHLLALPNNFQLLQEVMQKTSDEKLLTDIATAVRNHKS